MEKKSRRDRGTVKITAVGVLVLVVYLSEIFLYTWCTVQCRRVRREIGQQEKTAISLSAEKKELRIEIARLKSPARITGIAREKRGLVTPEIDQVIIIP